MKLDRIYTRIGDDGRTSLGDGARLPKFHVRVAAYGTVDEANAMIGVARLHVADATVRDVLIRIQNDLFDLGADLCRPEREHRKVEPLRMSERQVIWVEETIDAFNADLAALDSFVLPGGCHAAAHLHHARTVIRRAERYMTEIAYQQPGQSGGAEICEPCLGSVVRAGAVSQRPWTGRHALAAWPPSLNVV
jgi:cob(I)alamin adenosyltransferase